MDLKTNRVSITIAAPVQSGKSIMMDRIEKVLVGLGCRVESPDLEQERRLTNFSKPLADWEREMLDRAIVELKEVPLSRKLFQGDPYSARINGVYPIESLVDSRAKFDERWVIARPYVQPLLLRIKAAIAVLRGKAEAVSFYKQ